MIVLDDTGFAKQGKHSVGVARQYSGTLGKRGNCQVAVSLHYADAGGDYPLALRLYLPGSVDRPSAERLERARVPSAERTFKTKWQIALDLLDTLREEELPHRLVVADAGYGAVTEFREALEARREDYIVGLLGEESVFSEPPTWVVPAPRGAQGRPRTRAHLAEAAPRPVAIKALAEHLERTTIRWREGTKGWLEAEFAWVRVWPAHRWGNGVPAAAIPGGRAARWLLVEWRADGTIKYALSEPAAGHHTGAGSGLVEGALAG